MLVVWREAWSDYEFWNFTSKLVRSEVADLLNCSSLCRLWLEVEGGEQEGSRKAVLCAAWVEWGCTGHLLVNLHQLYVSTLKGRKMLLLPFLMFSDKNGFLTEKSDWFSSYPTVGLTRTHWDLLGIPSFIKLIYPWKGLGESLWGPNFVPSFSYVLLNALILCKSLCCDFCTVSFYFFRSNWSCGASSLLLRLISEPKANPQFDKVPVNPKRDQLWIFTGRTDAEAPVLWSLDAKSWLIGKDPNAGKDWGQEEKGATEDEMVGLHHWLSGHEFEQTPGDSEGQGSLACCSSRSRRVGYDLTTEQQQ